MIQPLQPLQPSPPKHHGRTYFSHRRAWSPRIWPIMIPTGLIVGLVAWFLQPVWYVSIAFGIAMGVGVAQVRFMVWKHRHPVITPAEFLDLRRKAAPWN